MSTVVVFPPVLGVRGSVLDAVDRLHRAGYEVTVVDPFQGRVFDTYEPALEHAEGEIGHAELARRAVAGVADLPDGFACLGFSLGCVLAAVVATRRPVSRVVMIGGAIPASALGPATTWPTGVPLQIHQTQGDPWREDAELAAAVADAAAAGVVAEVYDHPGTGHLFSDPGLPGEFDPVATACTWQAVGAFLAGVPGDVVERAAAALHERWRAERRRADGTIEPRWVAGGAQRTDGGAQPTVGGAQRIDIAALPFADLPPAYRLENRVAAAAAARLLLRSPDADPEWLAGEVHRDWRARHPVAGQPTPYDLLPEAEKAKDRAVLEVVAAALAEVGFPPGAGHRTE